MILEKIKKSEKQIEDNKCVKVSTKLSDSEIDKLLMK